MRGRERLEGWQEGEIEEKIEGEIEEQIEEEIMKIPSPNRLPQISTLTFTIPMQINTMSMATNLSHPQKAFSPGMMPAAKAAESIVEQEANNLKAVNRDRRRSFQSTLEPFRHLRQRIMMTT
jgi:hypothetical protein